MKLTRVLFIILFLYFCLSFSYASENGGGIVIFPSYTGNTMVDYILSETEKALVNVCYESGRITVIKPAGRGIAIEKSSGRDSGELYRNASGMLKADIYAVITYEAEKGDHGVRIDYIPLNTRYESLKRNRVFTSGIPDNLPLKAGIELASAMERLTLKARVTGINDEGFAMLDAGQWHGLEERVYLTSAGNITVRNISRFESVAAGENLLQGTIVEFNLRPKLDSLINSMKRSLKENTVRANGTDARLNKRGGAVRESIKGTCFINPGANLCLPGYGSFLSVDYMGIEKARPDIFGIFLGTTLTAAHIFLPSAMENFRISCFPWIKDDKRSAGLERLEIFLWATIPVTFTVSFYNQLVYQYKQMNLLPPVFENPDRSAAVISVFIPGGGMFYKGYRIAGFGFYLGEMASAGSAVYYADNRKCGIFLAVFGIIKAADIALAYFIMPSYPVWRNEVSTYENDTDFGIGFNRTVKGSGETTVFMSKRY